MPFLMKSCVLSINTDKKLVEVKFLLDKNFSLKGEHHLDMRTLSDVNNIVLSLRKANVVSNEWVTVIGHDSLDNYSGIRFPPEKDWLPVDFKNTSYIEQIDFYVREIVFQVLGVRLIFNKRRIY